MMKLPALPDAVAREARVFADDWIAEHRGPMGVFHPESETRLGKIAMKRWIEFHAFGADDVVYFAENGSEQAELALREVNAERTDANQPLGAVLSAYNIRLLNPSHKNPGPEKAANFVRDIGIHLLCHFLLKEFEPFGLRLYQSATRQVSASSIAAEALTKAGIGIVMGPNGVERIWKRYNPIMTGKFPSGYPGLFG